MFFGDLAIHLAIEVEALARLLDCLEITRRTDVHAHRGTHRLAVELGEARVNGLVDAQRQRLAVTEGGRHLLQTAQHFTRVDALCLGGFGGEVFVGGLGFHWLYAQQFRMRRNHRTKPGVAAGCRTETR